MCSVCVFRAAVSGWLCSGFPVCVLCVCVLCVCVGVWEWVKGAGQQAVVCDCEADYGLVGRAVGQGGLRWWSPVGHAGTGLQQRAQRRQGAGGVGVCSVCVFRADVSGWLCSGCPVCVLCVCVGVWEWVKGAGQQAAVCVCVSDYGLVGRAVGQGGLRWWSPVGHPWTGLRHAWTGLQQRVQRRTCVQGA